MARLFNDASNEYLTGASPLSADPLSMVTWFRTDDSAKATGQGLVYLGQPTTSNWFRLTLQSNVAGDPIRAQAQTLIGNNSADTTAGVSDSNWHHAAVAFNANGHVTVYLDGGNSASASGSTITPAGVDTITLGAWDNNTGYSNTNQFMSGDIAETAIYNIELTAADIASLASGVSPLLVRPESLVFYSPLIRNEDYDIVGGVSLSIGGTPEISAHPAIQRPGAQILQFPPVPAVGNTITANVTESGDTITATLEVDRNVTANVTESGDTVTASLIGIVTAEITANVTESGDTISASVTSPRNITANITEAGDTTTATMVGVVTAAITANVTESGDTISANLNVLLQILANVSESGDTVVATVGGLAPDVPGVEYTLSRNKLHYSVGEPLHYELPRNRLHWTLKD